MIKYIVMFVLVASLVFGATCSEGDGCDPSCSEGDKDCSCKTLKGYVCETDQVCPGVLMKNYNNELCCSEVCEEGEKLSENAYVAILTEKVEVEEEEIWKRPKSKKLGLIILILVGVIFSLMFLKKFMRKFSDYE